MTTRQPVAPTIPQAVAAIDKLLPLLQSGRAKLTSDPPGSLTTAEADAIASVMLIARVRKMR